MVTTLDRWFGRPTEDVWHGSEWVSRLPVRSVRLDVRSGREYGGGDDRETLIPSRFPPSIQKDIRSWFPNFVEAVWEVPAKAIESVRTWLNRLCLTSARGPAGVAGRVFQSRRPHGWRVRERDDGRAGEEAGVAGDIPPPFSADRADVTGRRVVVSPLAGQKRLTFDGARRAATTWWRRVRDVVRLATGETLDLKASEADRRHLPDTRIQADEPRKFSPFDGLDLIVKTRIADPIAERPNGLGGNETAIAEAIECKP